MFFRLLTEEIAFFLLIRYRSSWCQNDAQNLKFLIGDENRRWAPQKRQPQTSSSLVCLYFVRSVGYLEDMNVISPNLNQTGSVRVLTETTVCQWWRLLREVLSTSRKDSVGLWRLPPNHLVRACFSMTYWRYEDGHLTSVPRWFKHRAVSCTRTRSRPLYGQLVIGS